LIENYCTNYQVCRLVKACDFEVSSLEKEKYLKTYCRDNTLNWKSCKRYLAKNKMSFCPDFVLPDSTLSVDEIIDKFDEEEFDK